MEKVINWIKGISKKQLMIGAVVAVVLVSAAIAGVACYNYQNDLRTAQGEQEEKAPKKKKEKQEKEEKEEVIEVIQQTRTISFSGTSIEKDLKIIIVDESSTLISGTAFKITVFPEGAEDKGTEYADEDMDGLIHIQELAAGKYTVKLHEMEHFVITENPITVEVKGEIEYKKVNVSAEVKKESEINVNIEDSNSNQVPVEKPIINTLPFLESTVSVPTVEKQNISTANFPVASVSQEQNEEYVGQNTLQVPKTIVLYSQGGEVSKSCNVSLNIIGTRATTIQSIAWSIDNPVVASLASISDTEVKISALQNGHATIFIMITYIDEVGASGTKMMQMGLSVNEVTDSTTQLKDVSGNGLYLDKEGKQIAVLKDYGTTNVFYGAPQYTGWQTLDGKTYYFDENHQMVKGEQVIGYFKYTFKEDGSLVETKETRGIDVSKWQGTIDWSAVAAAGIDFAIIRVGYRGYTQGSLIEDPYFRQNIQGATKAGIKVGVYFLTQAITEAEAVEEASMAMQWVRGYHLDYPIYIDTEWSNKNKDGRADNLSKAQRTKVVKAFCKTVQNSGYTAGVYASKSWYQDNLYADELNDYVIWVAQYNTECTYTGKYDMWQYTKVGRIPGINGNVDLNICYKGK